MLHGDMSFSLSNASQFPFYMQIHNVSGVILQNGLELYSASAGSPRAAVAQHTQHGQLGEPIKPH